MVFFKEFKEFVVKGNMMDMASVSSLAPLLIK